MHLKENEPRMAFADVLATKHAPGDGTVYDLRVINVAHGSERIVVLLNARGGYGRAMALGALTPGAEYIAEKMGLNAYDAGVVHKYLQEVLAGPIGK